MRDNGHRMRSLRAELAAALARVGPAEGVHPTAVDGVRVVHYARQDRRTKRQWRACLAIVAQGGKEVVLGPDVHRCDEGRYTATLVPLPVVSRVATATPARPLLGILVDLDPLALIDLAARIDSPAGDDGEAPARAMFMGVADDDMLEAAIRLATLLRVPERARVLGPLVCRELFYHVLTGSEGAAIRQFVRAGSTMHRIASAMFALRTSLDATVNVAALAKDAGMSRSAFFERFRDVTAMSPIQYQKRLRLLEARRLMVDEDETAERSSLRVGYRSASQFSREYSRMFGASPRRDAATRRRRGAWPAA